MKHRACVTGSTGNKNQNSCVPLLRAISTGAMGANGAMTDKPSTDDYQVTVHAAGDMSAADRARCLEIIKEGDAVDPASAARELPAAQRIVIARCGEEIVAVGVVKRKRARYAASVAKKSNFQFAAGTPELGYVAVASNHQGARLSGRIVAGLVGAGDLFATTSNPRMKKTLTRAGFMQKGQEWKGRKGQLSLWLRNASKPAAK